MRLRSGLVVGVTLLALALAGCATPVASVTSEPGANSQPAVEPDDAGTDAAARAQAEAWLNAANLPSGAVRSDETIAGFSSYTGWPCGPIEQIEAFWTIPDATVTGTGNWLRENPTADLISTAGPSVPDDPAIDSTSVGFIPAADSQEGIVYTIMKTEDGVAVRAEIAALTESAVCPTPPGGGMWGAPGQG
ncbi:hypothetical protein [Microbacterium invictum]|uniref:Lipoprotein n=1 Tax=Microbacterium invictum TaxID=515415 RepID=A0AA40SLW1_9MICO|nr:MULTISPECIES: hypothetical protein [Microbacterium]MBB4138534.1 hypothetical protein [Microbacterium invictum]